jgi:molybdate transport system substrate-binding protein
VSLRVGAPVTARVATIVAIVVLVAAACSSGLASSGSRASGGPVSDPTTVAAVPSPTPAGTPIDLTIFGAASLTGVLDAVRTAYEAANPGVSLTISTGSSAAVETQIELGAPADVFLSADVTSPQKLVDKGLARGGPVTFARNLLTVIVPAANPAGIVSPADLARRGVKVIAAGDRVPITGYANELVANLARQPGYPADFAARYAANIVSKEDDVAAVVAKVALGEGDGAIVYLTDAKRSPQVAAVGVPDDANVVATYAGVVVRASPNQGAAEDLLAWLVGPEGQAILATFGFRPPS